MTTTTIDPDTVEPFTYATPGFWDQGTHNGYLGDYVIDSDGRKGRIYDVHVSCPEGAAWLMGQKLLGANPTRFKDCRWVSILVHGGGSIVVPEQLVTVIEPFEFENDWEKMHFRVDTP